MHAPDGAQQLDLTVLALTTNGKERTMKNWLAKHRRGFSVIGTAGSRAPGGRSRQAGSRPDGAEEEVRPQ